jgi:PPOX class probable FMN-dependent enzyme
MDVPGALTSVAALEALFGKPSPRALSKEINALDDNCRSFLAHSPFVAMGTTNPDGTGDVSPKGGPAGFVRVLDDNTIAWGELPGNNRLDGYRNLVRDPRIGLLFLIPGVDETLRINGHGFVTADPSLLELTSIDTGSGARRAPICVVVKVSEAFIHCAKAFRRSDLWKPEAWPATDDMPTIACLLVAHAGMTAADPDGTKTAASLEQAYAETMWNG